MEYKFRITVFTPTYNRAYIIENLYTSLQNQTFSDFEWLIVDDGSSDNTEEQIKLWQEQNNKFPIIYQKQKNGGKCKAINTGLDLANGKLFFTVDSDDYLTNDALEKINNWELELPKTAKYCGVAGNLGISATQTPNKLLDNEVYDGTLLDRYSVVEGERAIAIYTEVHKKYKYPCFENEKFMTEAVAWNRMAHDGYRMQFHNDIIWIYEYKEDGLTKAGNTLFVNNPKGYGLWLKEKSIFEHSNLFEMLKLYYTFTCELSNKYSAKQIASYIQTNTVLIKFMQIIHKFIS